VESEKEMLLSVVGRRFEDKVDLRLEGVQVFLSGPIEPSDGAKSSPEFCRQRNCCGGKNNKSD
jgi:hypothetical protein